VQGKPNFKLLNKTEQEELYNSNGGRVSGMLDASRMFCAKDKGKYLNHFILVLFRVGIANLASAALLSLTLI